MIKTILTLIVFFGLVGSAYAGGNFRAYNYNTDCTIEENKDKTECIGLYHTGNGGIAQSIADAVAAQADSISDGGGDGDGNCSGHSHGNEGNGHAWGHKGGGPGGHKGGGYGSRGPR